MKIGVFAYNFNHWKTQATIQNLVISGNKPDVIFAADKVELGIIESNIRISPRGQFLWHPSKIAEFYGIPYHVVVHNSEDTRSLIRDFDLDLGIISGARILKPLVIDPFQIGVINMHPGLLPENRGLDTIKWAVIKDIPQGASIHLINEKIDRGLLIEKREIPVYGDDSLLDLQIRIQNLEQELMIRSLTKVRNLNTSENEEIGVGNYHKPVPEEIEGRLISMFEQYKLSRGI